MELGLPDQDSEQSREGVLLHDFDAHPEYDRSVLRPDQRDLLDRNVNLKRQIADRLHTRIGIHPTAGQTERTLENGLISGTPDLITIYPTPEFSIWVNDSKFGYKVVERAEVNLQLRTYALLVFDAYGKRSKQIFVSITQPRLAYDERITLAEYKPDDISAAREEIMSILAKANEENAPLHASEEACRYCKAKLICPEFQKFASLLVSEFPHINRPVNETQALSKRAREAYLETRLAEISDDQIEKLLIARSFANMLSDPLLDEARKRKAISEDRLPNYFLEKERTVRSLADSQKAISYLDIAKVATRDELMKLTSLPIGKVTELYREKTDCTWKEAREKIDNVLASVLVKTEEKPRVIRK